MEKDLLELQRKNLLNVLNEAKENELDNALKKFAWLYTHDAVGMAGHNRVPYEEIKNLTHRKALEGYSEREQKEVLNHLKAFEFVQELVKSNKAFDEETLKDIHEILVEGIFQGGVYRNVNINIFGATHQPPDYVKVYDRMDRFFKNLKEFKGTTLEKSTFALANIAKIHPFIDANSRLAKLVFNYFLLKDDYLPLTIPLELGDKYIELLEIFKTEKDIKPLELFFKDLLIKRYEEVLQELDL